MMEYFVKGEISQFLELGWHHERFVPK